MSEFERLLDETLAVGMGDEYFQPWSKGLEVAHAALIAHHERVVQERDNAESALLRHGYRKSCDIPACNCGDQWNHGGNAADRLREISDEVHENGKTILASVRGLKAALAERDAALTKETTLCHRMIDERDHYREKAHSAEKELAERDARIAELERILRGDLCLGAAEGDQHHDDGIRSK